MEKDIVFDDSVLALKKTIPLMMKYNVPVLPNNYALWYSYVSNENPELNKEIDSVLASKNTFTDLHSESLFDRHMQSPEQETAQQLSDSVEDFAHSISQSIGYTHDGAKQFEQAMTMCHEELNGLDSDTIQGSKMTNFVEELISKSLAMRENAKGFSESLNSAQQEIKQLRDKLANSREQALRDELTGALNRRAFNEALAALISAQKEGSALIICDIDHFKVFNDTHGHLLGDQVLKVVANRLSQYDVDALTYRFGGEEFAILVQQGGTTVAAKLADELRLKIERLSIKDKKSQQRVSKITCSFGVAQYQVGQDSLEWIELADQRLYKAKESGRNRVISV